MAKYLASHFSHLAQFSYWERDKEPGKEAWSTIFSWIDQCDLVFALISQTTLTRAMSIGQEIGYAKSRKPIVPIVGQGVPENQLGCLQGITYIPVSSDSPEAFLEKMQAVVKRELSSKQTKEQNDALVLLGLIFGGLFLFGKD